MTPNGSHDSRHHRPDIADATQLLTSTSENFLGQISSDPTAWIEALDWFDALCSKVIEINIAKRFVAGHAGWLEADLRTPGSVYSPLLDAISSRDHPCVRINPQRNKAIVYLDGPDLGQAWARAHLFAHWLCHHPAAAGRFYISVTEVNEEMAEAEL